MRSILAERLPSSSGEWTRACSYAPLVIVIYFALQLAVRLCLSTNLEVDDAEMVGQTAWAWGYANSHPPLFHWLVRICYDAFGSWVAATALPKFTLLAAGYFFVYDAARRAAGSSVAGALAVAALLFVPVVSWKTEAKLTHSILGFAATAGMLHALVLIQTKGKSWTFAWLGLAAAAGVLAKYNFLIVLTAGCGAILCVSGMRRAMLRPAALLAPLILFVLIAPHLLWVTSHSALATERLYILRTGGGPLGMNLRADSLWDGLVSLFLVVLVSILPAFTIFAFAKFFSRDGEVETSTDRTMRRFAGSWILMEAIVLVLVMTAGGIFQIHERYVLVLLPPFAFWVALRFGLRLNSQGLVLVLATAAAVALTITIARPLIVIRGDSRLGWPYAQMAKEIGQLSGGPISILGDRAENAANSAIRIPGASIFDFHRPVPTVILVADGSDALQTLAKKLSGYEPAGEAHMISAPSRWRPQRKDTVVAQLWKKLN